MSSHISPTCIIIMDNKNSYDKIKHLVEVDDDIFAVFIVESSQIKDTHIAKNADIDASKIEFLFKVLDIDTENKNNGKNKETEKEHSNKYSILGNVQWNISEYDKLRILKIYEDDKTIVVLMQSNTKLAHHIDIILGYYFDTDDVPKSLF
jgi:hypothetical protein